MKKIKLNFNERNLYVLIKTIISLIFSIIMVLDRIIVFNGSVWGDISQIYFEDFKFYHFFLIIILASIVYFVISIIEKISDKLEKNICKKENLKIKNYKIFILAFFTIILLWLPYILSCFPGGIYCDTKDSIGQALGQISLNNGNPILYTLILRLFFTIGNKVSSIQLGMEMFSAFQVLFMAYACAYLVYLLAKCNVSIKYLIITTLFFGLFKLIPVYALSIWKDTPFSIAVFMYMIFFIEIVYKDFKNLEKNSAIAHYVILLFFVAFLRNNGIYVALGSTVGLILVNFKKIKNSLRKFTIVVVIELIIFLIIQGPIYNYYKISTRFVENVGIPLQQICYTVNLNGEITDEQMEFINRICPIEVIKSEYNPCIVDSIKWTSSFNHNFIKENKVQFLKVWFEIFLKNPVAYIKAYLLNTLGFWDVNVATLDGYDSLTMWGKDNEYAGIFQNDFIKKITNISIIDILKPKKAISSAVFMFIMILGMLITIYQKRYKNLLIYLPGLLTWMTIMVAAPIAFSLRYVFILVFMIPISIIVPFIKKEN